MDEIDKRMVTKDSKVMTGAIFPTLKELVNYTNSNFIHKSDIITILREGTGYSLVYYK